MGTTNQAQVISPFRTIVRTKSSDMDTPRLKVAATAF